MAVVCRVLASELHVGYRDSRLRAVRHAELREGGVEVLLHGAVLDAEDAGDLLVGLAVHQLADDIALARREFGDVLLARVRIGDAGIGCQQQAIERPRRQIHLAEQDQLQRRPQHLNFRRLRDEPACPLLDGASHQPGMIVPGQYHHTCGLERAADGGQGRQFIARGVRQLQIEQDQIERLASQLQRAAQIRRFGDLDLRKELLEVALHRSPEQRVIFDEQYAHRSPLAGPRDVPVTIRGRHRRGDAQMVYAKGRISQGG
jgi:hypothetical protein